MVDPSPCERVVSDVVLRAFRSSSSSLLAFLLLADVGRDDVEDPAAQHRAAPSARTSRRAPPAPAPRRDHMPRGSPSGRSSSARAITSACAVDTSPDRCALGQHRPPVRQRPGQRHVAAGGTPVDPELALAPRRHVPVTGLLGHLVRDRHQPQPGGIDTSRQPGELHATRRPCRPARGRGARPRPPCPGPQRSPRHTPGPGVRSSSQPPADQLLSAPTSGDRSDRPILLEHVFELRQESVKSSSNPSAPERRRAGARAVVLPALPQRETRAYDTHPPPTSDVRGALPSQA